jgi:hypothetical protein
MSAVAAKGGGCRHRARARTATFLAPEQLTRCQVLKKV